MELTGVWAVTVPKAGEEGAWLRKGQGDSGTREAVRTEGQEGRGLTRETKAGAERPQQVGQGKNHFLVKTPHGLSRT